MASTKMNWGPKPAPKTRGMTQAKAVGKLPSTPKVPALKPAVMPVAAMGRGKSAPVFGVSVEPSDSPLKRSAARGKLRPIPKMPAMPKMAPKPVGTARTKPKPKMGMG